MSHIDSLTTTTLLVYPPQPIGDWKQFQTVYEIYSNAGKLPKLLLLHPEVFEFWKNNYVTAAPGDSIAGIHVQTSPNQPSVTNWPDVFIASQPVEIKPAPFTADKKPSPKTLDSSHKIPVNLCPSSAIIAIALVIAQGHKKPGRTIYNWRSQPISYMEYMAAVQRHQMKSIDGEDFDKELSDLAGVPVRHDWAAMSGMAIIEDARQAGTLIDDRPLKGGAAKFLAEITIAPKGEP